MADKPTIRAEDLDHLHDSTVHAVTWRVPADEVGRDVVLSVTVHDEAEGPFAAYRGRGVDVVFVDAIVFRFSGHGNVHGPESFNSGGPERLPDGQDDPNNLRAEGANSGYRTVGIAFHSGSEVTIECYGIELVPVD